MCHCFAFLQNGTCVGVARNCTHFGCSHAKEDAQETVQPEMITRRRIPWSWTLYYTWPSLLYFTAVATLVYLLHDVYNFRWVDVPFAPVGVLGTALAIFLAFKNKQAYDRWWEARIIWGLLVNFSRAWSRKVHSSIDSPDHEHPQILHGFRRQLIFRHLAFINALRVQLRRRESFAHESREELVRTRNEFSELRPLLDEAEFDQACQADNAADIILHIQGRALRHARREGWLSEFRYIDMEQILVEMNHIQGRSERIKNTPFPRPYSYYQRVFVYVHATILPFSFVGELGPSLIPFSVVISFVFLVLDLIGARTEDPFENRMDDTPLSSLCRTIERNLRDALGDEHLPPKVLPRKGVVL